MSIKFLLTISCHKIHTKSRSKLHYNPRKLLNIHSYASDIREKLGSGFVGIFDKRFPDLSRIMSRFLVGPNYDPWTEGAFPEKVVEKILFINFKFKF